ncbi:MAG: hypothetical protein EX254_10555 [Flavobacteriaceae bacterium]|nr:MAG: hypothetical protein EX254_10555 [Flavobacteriaceae bacterium]
MKNLVYAVTLTVMSLMSCSSDPLINDDINSVDQKTSEQSITDKKSVKRPFKLKASGFYGAFIPSDDLCSDNLALNANCTGNATHLGRITHLEEWCWNGTQPDLGTRSIILKAANGDVLYGTPISVEWYSLFDFQEIVQIDGGTGRFENATGEFTQYVVISRDEIPSGDNVVSGTYAVSGSGTITY